MSTRSIITKYANTRKNLVAYRTKGEIPAQKHMDGISLLSKQRKAWLMQMLNKVGMNREKNL